MIWALTSRSLDDIASLIAWGGENRTILKPGNWLTCSIAGVMGEISTGPKSASASGSKATYNNKPSMNGGYSWAQLHLCNTEMLLYPLVNIFGCFQILGVVKVSLGNLPLDQPLLLARVRVISAAEAGQEAWTANTLFSNLGLGEHWEKTSWTYAAVICCQKIWNWHHSLLSLSPPPP